MTWVLSVVTVVSLYLMGNRSIWGPITGIISQLLWFVYIKQTVQYGFLPSVIVILCINVRNLIKWKGEADALRAKGAV